MNNKTSNTQGSDPGNTRVVIGGPDVIFHSPAGGSGTVRGFGLEMFETLTIAVTDDVIVFAIQDSNDDGNLGDADLRTIELA